MKQLLWINACMHGDGKSRTEQLSQEFLKIWKSHHQDAVILERDLTSGEMPVLTGALSQQRYQTAKAGELNSPLLEPAQELAQADWIVVSAPCWNMFCPAVLNIYLEWAAAIPVTFRYTREGELEGLCRAEKLLYITTVGGALEGQNLGFAYVRALGTRLGIDQIQCVAAENLDVWGSDVEQSLSQAREELRELALEW